MCLLRCQNDVGIVREDEDVFAIIKFVDDLDEIFGGRIHRLTAGYDNIGTQIIEELCYAFARCDGNDAVLLRILLHFFDRFFFRLFRFLRLGTGFGNDRGMLLLHILDLQLDEFTIALTDIQGIARF